MFMRFTHVNQITVQMVTILFKKFFQLFKKVKMCLVQVDVFK